MVADYFETWTVRYWEWLWSYTAHTHTETQSIAKEAVHLMHFVLNFECTSIPNNHCFRN